MQVSIRVEVAVVRLWPSPFFNQQLTCTYSIYTYKKQKSAHARTHIHILHMYNAAAAATAAARHNECLMQKSIRFEVN